MNISMTPQLEDFVQDKVESGLYTSASEVVRDALRLMEERDALRKAKLEALKHDIQKGVASLDAGQREVLDLDALKHAGRELLKAQQ